MNKYNIYNPNGWIEAERFEVQASGQIFFYIGEEIIAVMPRTSAVTIAKIKPREFDFVGQKEKLNKRNENLFAEKHEPSQIGDGVRDNEVERSSYMTEKRLNEFQENGTIDGKQPNEFKRARAEEALEQRNNYRANHQSKLLEIKKAHEVIVPVENEKLQENVEQRAVDQIENFDEESYDW